MSVFGEWEATLIRSIPTKSTIVDVTMSGTELTTVHFSYTNPKNVNEIKFGKVTVRKDPFKVYDWLLSYKRVDVPDSLKASIKPQVAQPIREAIHAAMGWHKPGVDVKAEFGDLVDIYRFRPNYYWKFSKFVRADQNNPRTGIESSSFCFEITPIELIADLYSPEKWRDLDHQAIITLFDTLRDEVFINLWLQVPLYFELIKALNLKKWETLSKRVERFLLSQNFISGASAPFKGK